MYYLYNDVATELAALRNRESKMTSALKILDVNGKREDLTIEAETLYSHLDELSKERKALELCICLSPSTGFIDKFNNGDYGTKTIKEAIRDVYATFNLNNIENQLNIK